MKIDKKTKKTKKTDSNSKVLLESKEAINKLENDKLRLMADFENLKKRKNDEISKLLKYSGKDLVIDLIPVFDDFDRILRESDHSSKNPLIEGLEIINNKLHKILSNLEITQFDSIGETFDPNFHDAIMTRKSKKKKNVIIEEFEKGYKYHDKVIKHSKVIVSEGK
tara:strand:- start:212 stop:709 length:498 start_codon:yes stop_codon:yes gene_type:complete